MSKDTVKMINRRVSCNDIYEYSKTLKIVELTIDKEETKDILSYYKLKCEMSNNGFDLVALIGLLISIIGMFVTTIVGIKEINANLKFEIAYSFTLYFLITLIILLCVEIMNKKTRTKNNLIYKILCEISEKQNEI